MKQSRASGFTLTRFIAALVILAFAALGTLFVWIHQARDSARQRQCMSNLKNIGIAMKMYLYDSDERFLANTPMIGGVRGWPTPDYKPIGRCTEVYSCGWFYDSFAYTRNYSVMLCPNWNRIPFLMTTDPQFYIND